MWSWSAKLLAASIALLLMETGCRAKDPPPPAPPSVQADVYSADFVALPASHTLSVINDVGGEIVVVVGSENEVAVDYKVTGTGDFTDESAIVDAETRISLTNVITGDGAAREVHVSPIGSPDSQDRVLLHLRVPAGTILSKVSNKSGNITLAGNLGNVAAVTTGNGAILVHGVNGSVDLKTGDGSIVADMMPHQSLRLRAANGDITIIATDATVNAKTSKGSINFMGDFHDASDNSLVTTGGGSIQIAIPPSSTYRVYAATSINPVITDLPPLRASSGITVCGLIHSTGPYDYHVENTRDRFGRIQVTPIASETYSYTGTLSSGYYRFEMEQTHIAFYAAQPINVHIYAEPELSQIIVNGAGVDQACQEALRNPDAGKFALHLSTGTGRIQIHYISGYP